MALLFTEGFDAYPNPIPLWYKWNRRNTATRVAGRTAGGYAMQPGHFDVVPKTVKFSTGLIVGFAIKPTNTGDSDYVVGQFFNESDQQIAAINMTNYNQAYFTDFGYANTDNTGFSIPLNQWSYIELKLKNAVTSAPAGSFSARGTVGPVITTFYNSPSGRNYNSGSNTNVCNFTFFARGDQQYDDVYICDTTGSYNNNFLGAIKIRTVFPTGNGSVTQLNPVGAGTNYQAVNNPSLSPDTTYVDSRIIGDKDLYLGGGVVTTPDGSIAGVTVNAVVRKDKSGYGHVKLPVRVNGTDSNGIDYYVPVGYQAFQRILDVNPISNLPWTKKQINSLQTGVMIS